MRTLNFPGSVPSVIDYAARWRAREAGWRAGLSSGEDRPILLEPTVRQLEAGIRVLWIDQTPCQNARLLAAEAGAAGWRVALSRSRFLAPVVRNARSKNNGKRVETETVAVRLLHEERALVGYAMWHQPLGGSFGFDTAQLSTYVMIDGRVLRSPARTLGWAEIREEVQGR